MIIEVAPSETEGLANLSNRVVRPQHLNDLALFRRSQLNHVEAFFWMSSATVNRPTSCSRWVIRSETASVDCLSVEANREVSAFSTSCCFHFESWSSLRLWCRQSSAWELSPLSASSTTSALNSAVNLLRFRLVLHRNSPFSEIVILSQSWFRQWPEFPMAVHVLIEQIFTEWNRRTNL